MNTPVEKYIAKYCQNCPNEKFKSLLEEYRRRYGSFESGLDLLAGQYGISYFCCGTELVKRGQELCIPMVRWSRNTPPVENCHHREYYTYDDAKVVNAKSVLYHLQSII